MGEPSPCLDLVDCHYVTCKMTIRVASSGNARYCEVRYFDGAGAGVKKDVLNTSYVCAAVRA